MIEKLEQGFWYSKPPVGYKKVNKMVVIDEDYAPFIKKAFYLKVELGLSNQRIVEELKILGWSNVNKQKVSILLKKPFYCGIIIHKFLDYKPVNGKHEKLVSEKQFIKVQELLSNNNSGYEHTTDIEEYAPLKRFIKCSCCETYLTAYERLKKEKLYYYYKCNKIGCRKK